MITVNTNVASLNAQRNLGISDKMLSKSLERLSSGLRINRASDDAAGLAISEGLRAQIRGLGQAVRNANDGISLVNTAESAVVETTSLLQRMRELAVQAASDTNSASNRAAMQNEIDQLISEVTRIGNTVQFNGQSLLDGSFTGKMLQIGAYASQTISISINDTRAAALGQQVEVASGAPTAAGDGANVTINNIGITTANDGSGAAAATYSAKAYVTAINGSGAGVTATAQANNVTAGNQVTLAGNIGAGDLSINGTAITVNGVTATQAGMDLVIATINNQEGTTGVHAEATGTYAGGGKIKLSTSDGRNIDVDVAAEGITGTGFAASSETIGTYKIASNDQIDISGSNPAQGGLTAGSYSALSGDALTQIDVSSFSGASLSISTIDVALGQVSDIRSALGAITNRLESTVSNLQTVSENLSASDSRIRDADFAAETASLTKAQILQQAGIAILAQANVTPQAALTLLK